MSIREMLQYAHPRAAVFVQTSPNAPRLLSLDYASVEMVTDLIIFAYASIRDSETVVEGDLHHLRLA
jgi:hypothetical protein